MTKTLFAQPFRLLLLVSLFAALLLSVTPAHAASFNVNTTLDGADTNPGDGRCLSISNRCTLRAAIQEANALAGTDTINVPAGNFVLTRAGFDDTTLNGDLDINGNLVIVGAGQAATVIDGNGLDRVFHITGHFKVTISDLTIQGGSVTQTGPGGSGILNLGGNLQLTRVTLRNNTTIEVGGGLQNMGTANLSQTTVATNSASTGGGIFNGGQLTIANSTINANQAAVTSGGGVANGNGTTTISFTTISNNTSTDGGGLLNTAGLVNITNSTISTNTTTFSGGGIQNTLDGTVNVVNSTISGNSAGTAGGAVQVSSGTATFASTTITANSASQAAGISNGAGLVKLKNTILGGNLGAGDCGGNLDSFGYNLIQNPTCSISGDTTGNIIGVSPLLGSLGLNHCGFGSGTPATMSHCATVFNSPIIDAANPAGCTDFNNVLLIHDQRGPGYYHSRHYSYGGGGPCDIGSMEINLDL